MLEKGLIFISGNIYIAAKSLTGAQRMERCILGAGVACTVARMKGKIPGLGCGYAVRVREGDFAQAVRILAQCGLKPGKAYTDAGGRYEEHRYDLS